MLHLGKRYREPHSAEIRFLADRASCVLFGKLFRIDGLQQGSTLWHLVYFWPFHEVRKAINMIHLELSLGPHFLSKVGVRDASASMLISSRMRILKNIWKDFKAAIQEEADELQEQKQPWCRYM